MPIYECECRSCGHRFEQFVRQPDVATWRVPACPACGEVAERVISSFAVDSASTRQTHLQQARKLNRGVARDKRMAEIEFERHVMEEHT